MTPPERLRTRRLSRRTFLRGAAASASVAALGTTAAAPAAAQSQFGGWLTSDSNGGEVKNFDGTTVDETGQSEVTVEVGAEGNGGTFAFAPPAIRVSPGTTVTFEWVSDTHNIFVQSQPDGANWQGHESIENTGFTHSHTFEATGVYKYYCQPHLPMGMKGAIVIGPAPGSGGDGESMASTGGPPVGDQRPGRVSVWEGLFAGSVLLGMLAPVASGLLGRESASAPAQRE